MRFYLHFSWKENFMWDIAPWDDMESQCDAFGILSNTSNMMHYWMILKQKCIAIFKLYHYFIEAIADEYRYIRNREIFQFQVFLF